MHCEMTTELLCFLVPIVNKLSMLIKKVCPFLLLNVSIWLSGFLTSCIEISVVQMWLCIHSHCRSQWHSRARVFWCLLLPPAPLLSLSPAHSLLPPTHWWLLRCCVYSLHFG